jgi:hypothetical protein
MRTSAHPDLYDVPRIASAHAGPASRRVTPPGMAVSLFVGRGMWEVKMAFQGVRQYLFLRILRNYCIERPGIRCVKFNSSFKREGDETLLGFGAPATARPAAPSEQNAVFCSRRIFRVNRERSLFHR